MPAEQDLIKRKHACCLAMRLWILFSCSLQLSIRTGTHIIKMNHTDFAAIFIVSCVFISYNFSYLKALSKPNLHMHKLKEYLHMIHDQVLAARFTIKSRL